MSTVAAQRFRYENVSWYSFLKAYNPHETSRISKLETWCA